MSTFSGVLREFQHEVQCTKGDWCGTASPPRIGCCKAGTECTGVHGRSGVLRVRVLSTKPGARCCEVIQVLLIPGKLAEERVLHAAVQREVPGGPEIREEYTAEELNSIIYDHNRALESVYEKDIEALPDMQNIEAEIDDVAGLQPYGARELIEDTGGACLFIGHVTPLERARVLGDADMVKLGSAAHIVLHHSFVRMHESIRTAEARAELKRFPKEVRRSLVQALRVRLLCARAPADAWEAVLYAIITPEGWGGRRE